MKLSIIIPIYNAEKYLDECISSLYRQGLDNDEFEVLLINDGSTDSSLTIAEKWLELSNNITILDQQNCGQATARNNGLDNASGEYIMFIDSDDYLLPNKLVSLVEQLEKKQLDGIVYNLREQKQDGSSKVLKIQGIRYDRIYSGEEVVLESHIFGSMCRGIFSRSVFENNNLRFRIGFTHEDSELCFRLYPLLKKIIFVDDEVYFYRYNVNSTDRSQSIERLKKNIESDAILVSKILEDIEHAIYTRAVSKRYRKIANSAIIGFLGRIHTNRIWNNNEFNDKLSWLKDLGVYPLNGPTCSWRSNILAKLYNIEIILKLYLCGKLK